jgi:HK97 gp10 family phage protein
MSKSVVVKGSLEGAEDLIAALQAVGLSVKGTTRKGVRAGLKAMQVNAERRGRARSSRPGKATAIKISSKQRGAVTGALGPSKKKWYLRFLETGAKPHVIKGRPMLRFLRSGKLITARRVKHPGFSAKPWLRPAFDESTAAALAAFGAAMRQALETRRAQLDNATDED